MVFDNKTPFPAIAWENVDADNSWNITTVARVKFLLDISQDGVCSLRLDPEQGELWSEDLFYGKVGQSSVRYESDYVTFKPTTDIIVNANGYIPPNKNSVLSSIWVMDPQGNPYKTASLLIRSPQGAIDKGQLLPIRYEYAKGGGYPTPTEDDPYDYETLDPYNPVGMGVYDDNSPDRQKQDPYIIFDDPAMQEKRYPAGFGIVWKAWASRLQYAGTYDDEWINYQHPLPPHNFDYRFNQAANPALQLDRYIDLFHRIRLENLSVPYPILELEIPDLVLFSQQHTPNVKSHFDTMHIDTVIVDIDGVYPSEWSLYISYRSFVPKKNDYQKVSCHFITKELLSGDSDG